MKSNTLILGIGYTFVFAEDTSYCRFWGEKTSLNRQDCNLFGGSWISQTTYPREGYIIAMLGFVVSIGGFLSPPTEKTTFSQMHSRECPNCGNKTIFNSQYCNYCGFKLIEKVM